MKSQLFELGYHSKHLCVDAAAFVPQSRSRVFLLGKKGTTCDYPDPPARRMDLRLFDVASRRGDWWNEEQKERFLDSLSPLQGG